MSTNCRNATSEGVEVTEVTVEVIVGDGGVDEGGESNAMFGESSYSVMRKKLILVQSSVNMIQYDFLLLDGKIDDAY